MNILSWITAEARDAARWLEGIEDPKEYAFWCAVVGELVVLLIDSE